jgi:hypothetical protein
MIFQILFIIILIIIINYIRVKSLNILNLNCEYLLNENEKIKILTFNCHKIPLYYFPDVCIHKLISKYDVICLQENFTSILGTNKNHFGYNCVIPGGNILKLIDSGLSIYSKYNITYIDFIPFDNLLSVDKYSSKGFLIVQIKDIIFINTHLQTAYNECDNEIIMKQIKSILNKCSIFFKVIIVGDFNINLKYFLYENNNFNIIIPKIPTHWNKPYQSYNTYSSAVPENNLFPYFYDGGFYRNLDVKNINTKRHDMLTDHLGVSFDLIDIEDGGIPDEYFYTYLGSNMD